MNKNISCLVLVAFFAFGCSKSTQVVERRVPTENTGFSNLKNISTASSSVRVAARAIVRIKMDGVGDGTGSFISRDGLLMTNNHVLGIDDQICAREGCLISLAFDYQNDLRFNEQLLFAEPLAVGPESDVAFFQIWTNSEKTRKYDTPNFLQIENREAKELIGEPLYVIGHPNGNLKKWLSATAVSRHGHFVILDASILGGNSGSPVLDRNMKVVGIVHHGRKTQGDYGRFSVVSNTQATDSRELLRVKDLANVNLFPSAVDRRAVSWISENHSMYLSAGSAMATREDGVSVRIVDVLAETCDKALAQPHFRSIEDFNKAVTPCRTIQHWLSCNNPLTLKKAQSCPSGDEAELWRNRFLKLYSVGFKFAMSSNLGDLSLINFLEVHVPARAAVVTQMLQSEPLVLNHASVSHMISMNVPVKIGGRPAIEWVRQYKKTPNYEADYTSISGIYFRLFMNGELTIGELKAFVKQALSDPKISLIDFLEIEDSAYIYGVL